METTDKRRTIGRREVDLWRESQIEKCEQLISTLNALVKEWKLTASTTRSLNDAVTYNLCAERLFNELRKYGW